MAGRFPGFVPDAAARGRWPGRGLKQGEFNFSLSPTETLDAISEALGTRMGRDPEARRKMVESAQGALAKLKSDWTNKRFTWRHDAIEPVVEKRTAAQLTNEQDYRQAEAFERALAAEGLGPREHSRSKDSMQYEAWQRFQESKHLLLKKGLSEAEAEQLANASASQWHRDHAAKIDRALAKAKAEAAAWREEADAMQERDWSPRKVLIRNMRILDAVLAAFPPEVRAKVGGYITLARLTTDKAMAKEIESRIKALDIHLEESLQNSLREDIAKLMDKAAPKRKGGEKPKGHLGAETHNYFEAVADVMAMTDDQVEGRRAEIAAEYDRLDKAGELTPAAAAALYEQEQILDQFGNLNGTWRDGKLVGAKSAAHLARCLDMLTETYETGRNRWRTQEEARLEEVKDLVKQTVAALGGVSRAGIQKQKKAAEGALALLKSGKWSIKSFTEVMEALFGRGHPLAVRWANAVRRGFAQRTTETVGLIHRWRRAMNAATGLKGRKARHAVWTMSHEQTLKVHAAPFRVENVSVPVEKFAQVLAGEVEPKALDLTAAEVDTLTKQFEDLPPDSRKGNLTLERMKPGSSETVPLTEAEGIFLSMLYAQEAYQEALQRDGYGPEAMSEIEEQLSPAAKSLREFLQQEYKDGYEPLARVFRRMFGVDLPSIPNYAPGAFYHTGGSEASADPFGPIMPEGGFRAGFLRDRKPHRAAPKAQSAFSTFFGHFNQAAHWKALAEVTRELRAVFGNPDVKRALTGAHGEEATAKVNLWLGAIEGNGINVASSRLARAIFTMQAHVALAWKLGTLMKQSTALLGAWYRMPTGAYLRGLGRLFTGKLNAIEMWKSETMQRRIVAGFTPEVRAVMANAWNTEPTWRNAFLEKGMEIIGLTDAFFTTGSAAICYDYHYRQAKKAGQTDAVARAIAEQEAADMVSRTAQPVEVSDRSLMELNLGGLGRAAFVFASEARQKSSLWLTAWAHTLSGKPTKEDIRVLFIAHMVLGPMVEAISSLWRDFRDDDDDEFFDIDHWSPGEFLEATVTTPLSGLPLVRDVVDAFHGESGPLARYYYALVAGKAILFDGPEATDPERVEWYAKRAFAVLQAGGSFTAVSGSIGDQAFRIGDNLFDDELETGKKQLKKEADERDALREAAITDEQREAKEAAKREETEAKLKAAAQRAN